MNCSVKFFDPTVTWTPLLSGFASIRSALASPPSPSSSSSSPPHATTPSARTTAANRANSARSLESVLIESSSPLSVDAASADPIQALSHTSEITHLLGPAAAVYRVGELHAPDHVGFGHPHSARRLDRSLVDLANRDECIGQYRRDPDHRARQGHVEHAHSDERGHERDQRQFRDGSPC